MKKIEKRIIPKIKSNDDVCPDCVELTEEQAMSLINGINNLGLEKRKIYIFSPIDSSVSASVISSIHYMEEISDDDIEIIINSPGGYVIDCLAIIDAMDSSECDFVTKTYGIAASAACLIATNGSHGKRHAGKNTEFMFHEVYGSVDDFRASTADEIKKENARHQKKFTKLFGRNTGMTEKEIKNTFYLTGKDRFLTAQEAKKYGLVDHIMPVRRKCSKKSQDAEENQLNED